MEQISSSSCQYFVPRKKRNCRMLVKPGKKFCGEHDINSNLISESKDINSDRIPCPNDPKHTCSKAKLEKHLKKCPAKPKERPDYCEPGCNANSATNGKSNEAPLTLNTISDEELTNVIKMVEDVYEKEVMSFIEDAKLSHSILDKEIVDNPNYGPSVLKHLKQNSSLIGHLKSKNLLNDPAVYVEFGSGRGQLTFWLIQAVKNKHDSDFILIDRESHRHKFDNRLKDDSNLSIQRIRVDLADVKLEKCPRIADKSKPLIGISKHLCGGATDLTLRSLERAQADDVDVKAIMIALCCHHRCQWDLFVGKSFLRDVGFDQRLFNLLCGLTSWATCGSGQPRERKTPVSSSNDKGGNEDKKRHDNRYERLDLPRPKREDIGRKVKRILDMARLKFMQNNLGLEVSLFYYCDQQISLENLMIIGIKKGE